MAPHETEKLLHGGHQHSDKAAGYRMGKNLQTTHLIHG